MRLSLSIAACAFWLVGCLVARAYLPATHGGQGAPAAAAAYSGPGDVVSGATAFWSCTYAYNAAYATANSAACTVQRIDNATCTAKFASTGAVDLSTAYCNSNTQSLVAFCDTCTINSFADQTGNGNTASVSGSKATLAFSCINSLPCTDMGGGSRLYLTAGSVAISQPMTLNMVADRVGNTTSFAAGLGTVDDNSYLGWLNSANTARAAGSTSQITRSMTDNAFHAELTVLNGASSVLAVDNAETTGSPGAAAVNSKLCLGGHSTNCGSDTLQGKVAEAGFWPSGFSSGNRTSWYTNASTRYGGAF